MIRYRVQPKPLPNVKEEHLPGIFGRFEDVIDARIARYQTSEDPLDREKARFFAYLRDRVDPVEFGNMQEAQLSGSRLDLNKDFPKYIDPTLWFESKLAMARRIGLHQREPLNILDIGTGPGHFLVVAEFYGHRVVGTDLPKLTTGDHENGHLYDSLSHIYKTRRLPLKIEEFQSLPAFQERYDLTTALLAAFNVDSQKQPWSIGAWKFFLDDLSSNILVEDGELFMALANGKLTPEVWGYLSQHAAWKIDQSKQIHFKWADLLACIDKPERGECVSAPRTA